MMVDGCKDVSPETENAVPITAEEKKKKDVSLSLHFLAYFGTIINLTPEFWKHIILHLLSQSIWLPKFKLHDKNLRQMTHEIKLR